MAGPNTDTVDTPEFILKVASILKLFEKITRQAEILPLEKEWDAVNEAYQIVAQDFATTLEEDRAHYTRLENWWKSTEDPAILVRRVEDLEKNIAECKEKLQESEGRNTEMSETVSTLTNALKEKLNEVESAENKLNDAKEGLKDTREQIRDLQHRLDKCSLVLNPLREEIKGKEAVLKVATDELEKIEKQCDAWDRKSNELEKTWKRHNISIETLDRKVRKLKDVNYSLDGINTDLRCL